MYGGLVTCDGVVARCKHMSYLFCVTITLDTNVLLQAFFSRSGASHAVFRLIRDGHLRLALSVPVFEEYRAVLSRPKNMELLGLSPVKLETILRFVAFVSSPTVVHYLWRPNLRDEADNMFVELAVASESSHLITQNTRDFVSGSNLKHDAFRVVTPYQFLVEWRQSHGT